MAQPEKGPDRTSNQVRSSRLSQLFSAPKSKEPVSAQKSLLAMQQNATTATITAPSLSLPSISLSHAKGGEPNSDDPPTTLFSPPSAQESSLQRKAEAQFGPLLHESHRYVSKHKGDTLQNPYLDEASLFYIFTTYISYLLLIVVGHTRDFFGKRFGDQKRYRPLRAHGGYASLNDDFDNFYIRRLKLRLDDCFMRITTGVPGRFITLLDRASDDFNRNYTYTGGRTETLNISSYNYLGFAQSEGPCADATEECIRKYGLTTASPRNQAGTTDLALDVEREIANFVGQPAAMVFSMGYVTNSSTFPALVGKGCLIVSDELNHASIRVGARLSGAVIRAFEHNNMKDLEKVLRNAISQGQPRTHRPWKKILVAVEGLYSMEGDILNLPGILALKPKYKFHLFVDEAHSVGALGPRGRGVCDYFGVDPTQVDILMGTLTKSFGANGGYVAGSKAIISKLKLSNVNNSFGESPSPGVLAQILSSLRMITGELSPGQGEERLQRIAFNSRYLRLGLKRLGFIVYGHDDSPIVPVLLYHPGKMAAFSHEMLKRKISVVVVGYPATPLMTSRARFCMSSAHNKDDLDRILEACDEVGDVLQLKFSTGKAGGLDPLPAGVAAEVEKEWRRENGTDGAVKPPRWDIRDVIESGTRDTHLPLR